MARGIAAELLAKQICSLATVEGEGGVFIDFSQAQEQYFYRSGMLWIFFLCVPKAHMIETACPLSVRKYGVRTLGEERINAAVELYGLQNGGGGGGGKRQSLWLTVF